MKKYKKTNAKPDMKNLVLNIMSLVAWGAESGKTKKADTVITTNYELHSDFDFNYSSSDSSYASNATDYSKYSYVKPDWGHIYHPFKENVFDDIP